MKNSNLQLVKKTLTDSFETLQANSAGNIVIVNKIVQTLEGALLDKYFTLEEENELYSFMQENNMLSIFQKAYEIFETNLETEFASSLINEKGNPHEKFSNYLLYKRFVTLLTNEISLASITNMDKVLFIGSGPIPITAILMHELCGAKVDCGERYKPSADLSEKVLAKLNYTDFIHVINKDGVDTDYSQYSVILVALLAKPKSELLKTIWKQAPSGTRIICRTSDLVRQAFYETTQENLFRSYTIVKKLFATGDQTISSILLIKS
jgi:precorrin-6B methylase 2